MVTDGKLLKKWSAYMNELKKGKGEFKKNCARSACDNNPADFYNHSTLKYYCGKCAHEINTWATDFEKETGHKLCVKSDKEI